MGWRFAPEGHTKSREASGPGAFRARWWISTAQEPIERPLFPSSMSKLTIGRRMTLQLNLENTAPEGRGGTA